MSWYISGRRLLSPVVQVTQKVMLSRWPRGKKLRVATKCTKSTPTSTLMSLKSAQKIFRKRKDFVFLEEKNLSCWLHILDDKFTLLKYCLYSYRGPVMDSQYHQYEFRQKNSNAYAIIAVNSEGDDVHGRWSIKNPKSLTAMISSNI